MSANNEPLRQALESFLDLPETRVEEPFEDRNGQILVKLVSTQAGTPAVIIGPRAIPVRIDG